MRAMDYLWHKIVVQLQNLALMVIWEIRPKKMVREQFLQGQWTWWILPSFSRPYKDLLKSKQGKTRCERPTNHF